MSAPTPDGPFSAELEATYAAARADLDAAATSDPTDRPAWCRRMAEARRTLANLYQLAMTDVPTHSLAWWALHDAAQLCESHINHLLAQARHTPKGHQP